MTSVWALAALWLGLAVVATLFSIWLRISTALSEIAVGTITQLILGLAFGPAVLGTDEPWVKFLAGIGAIVLTFLAGAELDPKVFKLKWKEAATVGLASFLFPFLGCAAAARYWLGWEVMPSWLARGRHVDHVRRGRLRRDVGIRLQRNGLRQDNPGRLLHHRSWNCRGAGPHLCAVYGQDRDISCCRCGGHRVRAMGDAPLVQTLWRAAFGVRNEVFASLPAWNGGARRLGRQRSRPSRLSNRNGACWDRLARITPWSDDCGR